jgi:hypothetical protein
VPESASGGSATSTRERFARPERISTAVLIGAAAMFCKAFGVFSLSGAAGLGLRFSSNVSASNMVIVLILLRDSVAS